VLKVNEIFYSIQGECSCAGRPCVFVRLTGCNLRCTYCDTQYAYHEGRELEIRDIVEIVSSYKCPLVEVTGGEPLIQEETPVLIKTFLKGGYQVLLETNGSQDISRIDGRCIRVVDIKCPSSGEEKKNDLRNLSRIGSRDEIKFVIGGREDYDFAKNVLDFGDLNALNPNQVHFSPVFARIEPKVLAGWILEDRLDVRLHLQLHKIIWEPERRGV
jgi:7-carboxy-7-deazaguanine synthase